MREPEQSFHRLRTESAPVRPQVLTVSVPSAVAVYDHQRSSAVPDAPHAAAVLPSFVAPVRSYANVPLEITVAPAQESDWPNAVALKHRPAAPARASANLFF
jgi:hypothetical protein